MTLKRFELFLQLLFQTLWAAFQSDKKLSCCCGLRKAMAMSSAAGHWKYSWERGILWGGRTALLSFLPPHLQRSRSLWVGWREHTPFFQQSEGGGKMGVSHVSCLLAPVYVKGAPKQDPGTAVCQDSWHLPGRWWGEGIGFWSEFCQGPCWPIGTQWIFSTSQLKC